MVEERFDFLKWTSPPSSLLVVNEKGTSATIWRRGSPELYLVPLPKPGHVRLECNVMTRGAVEEHPAWVAAIGYGPDGRTVPRTWFRTNVAYWPRWVRISGEHDMPEGVVMLAVRLVAAGSGVKGRPATTWYDDLAIYLDGELMYENKFTNWSPYAGAVLGAVLGGAAAWLSGRRKLCAAAAALAGAGGAALGWVLAKP